MFKRLRDWLEITFAYPLSKTELRDALHAAIGRADRLYERFSSTYLELAAEQDKLAACEAGHLELQKKLAAAEKLIDHLRKILDPETWTTGEYAPTKGAGMFSELDETEQAMADYAQTTGTGFVCVPADAKTTFPPDPVGARAWLYGDQRVENLQTD